MMCSRSLPLLLGLGLLDVSLASGGTACSSGIYKELLFLSNYAPAKSYCSDHYPLPVVTVTATAVKREHNRRAQTTATLTTTSISKISSTSSTIKTTASDAIWSNLLKSAQSIVATVCSCIETESTKTITLTPSSTKSSTFKTSTTSLSTTKPSSTTKSSSATSRSASTTTTRSSSITTKSSSTVTKSSSSTTKSSTTTSTRNTPTVTRCNPSGAQPTFYLKASAPGTIDDGRYALQSNTGGNDIVTFVPEISNGATTFSFDASCHLIGFGTPGIVEIANIDAGATNGTVYFNTADQIAQATNPGAVAATCDISNGVLQCVDQTATMFFVCTNQLQLQIGATIPPDHPIGGPAGSMSGPCVRVTLTPIYQ